MHQEFATRLAGNDLGCQILVGHAIETRAHTVAKGARQYRPDGEVRRWTDRRESGQHDGQGQPEYGNDNRPLSIGQRIQLRPERQFRHDSAYLYERHNQGNKQGSCPEMATDPWQHEIGIARLKRQDIDTTAIKKQTEIS